MKKPNPIKFNNTCFLTKEFRITRQARKLNFKHRGEAEFRATSDSNMIHYK